jgi:hypothetical protein
VHVHVALSCMLSHSSAHVLCPQAPNYSLQQLILNFVKQKDKVSGGRRWVNQKTRLSLCCCSCHAICCFILSLAIRPCSVCDTSTTRLACLMHCTTWCVTCTAQQEALAVSMLHLSASYHRQEGMQAKGVTAVRAGWRRQTSEWSWLVQVQTAGR